MTRGPAFLLSWLQSAAARSTLLRVGQVITAPSGGIVGVTIGDQTYQLPHLGAPSVGDDVWVICAGRTWLVLAPCITEILPQDPASIYTGGYVEVAATVHGTSDYAAALTDGSDDTYVRCTAIRDSPPEVYLPINPTSVGTPSRRAVRVRMRRHNATVTSGTYELAPQPWSSGLFSAVDIFDRLPAAGITRLARALVPADEVTTDFQTFTADLSLDVPAATLDAAVEAGTCYLYIDGDTPGVDEETNPLELSIDHSDLALLYYC